MTAPRALLLYGRGVLVRVAGRDLKEDDFFVLDTAGHLRRLIRGEVGHEILILAEEVGPPRLGPDEPVVVDRGAHELCTLDWKERQARVAAWDEGGRDAPAE